MDKKDTTRKISKNEQLLREFAVQLRNEQKTSGRHSPISAEHAKFVLRSLDSFFRSQVSRRPIGLHQAFQLGNAGNPGKSEQESIEDAAQALKAWRVQLELELVRGKRSGQPRQSGRFYISKIAGQIGWHRDEKSLRTLMNKYRAAAWAQIIDHELSGKASRRRSKPSQYPDDVRMLLELESQIAKSLEKKPINPEDWE